MLMPRRRCPVFVEVPRLTEYCVVGDSESHVLKRALLSCSVADRDHLGLIRKCGDHPHSHQPYYEC